jgi:hypothetical protein
VKVGCSNDRRWGGDAGSPMACFRHPSTSTWKRSPRRHPCAYRHW